MYIAARIKEINLKLDGFAVAIAIRGKNNFLYLVATLLPSFTHATVAKYPSPAYVP